MAIIYNYPIKTEVSTSDQILISDSEDEFETKVISVGTLPGVAGSVSSFSGGVTGLLPNTAEFGDIVLSGVLQISAGGTEGTTAQEAINNITSVDNGAVNSVLTNTGTNAVWKALPTALLVTAPNGAVYEIIVDNDGNLDTVLQGDGGNGNGDSGGDTGSGDGDTGSGDGDTGSGDGDTGGGDGDTGDGDTGGGDTGDGDTGDGDTGDGYKDPVDGGDGDGDTTDPDPDPDPDPNDPIDDDNDKDPQPDPDPDPNDPIDDDNDKDPDGDTVVDPDPDPNDPIDDGDGDTVVDDNKGDGDTVVDPDPDPDPNDPIVDDNKGGGDTGDTGSGDTGSGDTNDADSSKGG